MKKITLIAIVVAAALTPAYATHGILLVSDQVDGVENPQEYDSFYINALRDAGYTYTLWDHYTQGEPGFEVLRKYKTVIWFTSTSGAAPASDPLHGSITLTPSEQKSLVRFLSQTPGTTTLMLSGMYIAWNCVADAENERQLYKPLFSDYLKLDYPQDNFDNWIKVDDDWVLEGEAGSPFNGQSYDVNWRHHKNWPDQLEPAAGASGAAWWRDDEGHRHHRGVLRASGAKAGGGTYKIILFSCPFENILHDGMRAEVMANFLAWAEPEGENSVEPASLGRIKSLYR
ncbi:MAG: hypothetical protein PVH29_12990 [Candidatus Zixiibacteriota bacterium]|jgi:hypothetical protein